MVNSMDKILYKSGDFEGPLDLMLHLIRKNKLNIQDICISELLEQYMSHIEDMSRNNIDIASEFLEMAARLVYIKTVSLLPQKEDEKKLKKELSDQIMEYEECKKLAELLRTRADYDSFVKEPENIDLSCAYTRKHNVSELLKSYLRASLKGKKIPPKPDSKVSAIVSRRIISVYSKVIYIFRRLRNTGTYPYNGLFTSDMGKSAVIATFLAVLELIKVNRISIKENNGILNLLLNRR